MVWGILGIIATVIVGLIPLLLSFRDRTIRYWHVETESIFSQKIKEVKKLKVLYNDEEINDNIIILKTIIENNGQKDIDRVIVHEPLKISFSDSIELLEVEVLKAPCGINVLKEDNSIICKWDLLKKKEFIVLKVLLRNKDIKKTETSNDLLKKHSKLSFRITDLSKPRKINYTESISNKIDYKAFLIPVFYLFIAVFMILSLTIKKQYKLEYQDNIFEGNYYSMQGKDETSLILKCDKRKQTISIDDYNNRNSITKLRILPSKENDVLIVLSLVILFLSLVMFALLINRISRDKKVFTFFNDKNE